MSEVIQFPSDRQVVSRFTLSDGVDCITLDGYGDQLFVTDRALGEALGYQLLSGCSVAGIGVRVRAVQALT